MPMPLPPSVEPEVVFEYGAWLTVGQIAVVKLPEAKIAQILKDALRSNKGDVDQAIRAIKQAAIERVRRL